MIALTLAEVAELTGGALTGSPDATVTGAVTLDSRTVDELLEHVEDEIDDILLIVDHQDSRALVGLGAEPERGLQSAELTRANAEVPAGGPERFELPGLDPVLHGAHGHLAPPRDLARGQITHQDLKKHVIQK